MPTGQSVRRTIIYTLTDPRSGLVRYVGKTHLTPEGRLRHHQRDAAKRDTPVYRWFNALQRLGMTPVIEPVCTAIVESDWPHLEIATIAQHREHGKLLNVAEGGSEPHCPPEVRVENGRRLTQGEKGRFIQLKRMATNAWKAGYMPEASKEKLRHCARTNPKVWGTKWLSMP